MLTLVLTGALASTGCRAELNPGETPRFAPVGLPLALVGPAAGVAGLAFGLTGLMPDRGERNIGLATAGVVFGLASVLALGSSVALAIGNGAEARRTGVCVTRANLPRGAAWASDALGVLTGVGLATSVAWVVVGFSTLPVSERAQVLYGGAVALGSVMTVASLILAALSLDFRPVELAGLHVGLTASGVRVSF